MMQSEKEFTQAEATALGQILSAHDVQSAVLIYLCDDGSQSELVITADEGEGWEEVERRKQLVAIDLAKSMIGNFEAGGGKTLRRMKSR
jgi:hypothetical protein